MKGYKVTLWLRRSLVAGLVITLMSTALLMGTDALLRHVAPTAASRFTGGCAGLEGTTVQLGPWPAAPRLARGRLRHVTAAIREVRLGALRVHDVQVRLSRVTLPPLRLLSGRGAVDVEGVVSGHIAYSDLAIYLLAHGPPRLLDATRLFASGGVELRAVRLEAGGLRVTAAISGSSSAVACAAREGLS